MLTSFVFIASLALRAGQDRPAPYLPVVWVTDQPSKKISSVDLSELQQQYESATKPVKLKSGNFGMAKSGVYLLIDRKAPLLARLENKYLLAKRLCEIASSGKSANAYIAISGLDLSEAEQSALSEATEHWIGLKQSSARISSYKTLLFNFSQEVIFSSANQNVSVIYRSPDLTYEEYQRQRALTPKAGMMIIDTQDELREYNERTAGLEKIGTELIDAGVSIRVFGLEPAHSDIIGFQRIGIDGYQQVYRDIRVVYEAELNRILTPFKSQTPFYFPNADAPTLPEGTVESLRIAARRTLTDQGVAESQAKRALENMIASSPKLSINFYTKFQIVGRPPANFAATIRIWP
jgi:hypothetical protein